LDSSGKCWRGLLQHEQSLEVSLCTSERRQLDNKEGGKRFHPFSFCFFCLFVVLSFCIFIFVVFFEEKKIFHPLLAPASTMIGSPDPNMMYPSIVLPFCFLSFCCFIFLLFYLFVVLSFCCFIFLLFCIFWRKKIFHPLLVPASTKIRSPDPNMMCSFKFLLLLKLFPSSFTCTTTVLSFCLFVVLSFCRFIFLLFCLFLFCLFFGKIFPPAPQTFPLKFHLHHNLLFEN